MLSLATITHVSSKFKIGTDWETAYIIIAMLLFILPLLAMLTGTAWELRQEKKVHVALSVKRKLQGAIEKLVDVNRAIHGAKGSSTMYMVEGLGDDPLAGSGEAVGLMAEAQLEIKPVAQKKGGQPTRADDEFPPDAELVALNLSP